MTYISSYLLIGGMLLPINIYDRYIDIYDGNNFTYKIYILYSYYIPNKLYMSYHKMLCSDDLLEFILDEDLDD